MCTIYVNITIIHYCYYGIRIFFSPLVFIRLLSFFRILFRSADLNLIMEIYVN